jgi:acyl-coenzyme A thioesterase PaaI-like protein
MTARDDAAHCFVCGPANPIGLKLAFTVQDRYCHGEFTSRAEHAGFDGVTHGGIVFSVLDDAMANWFYLQGARGYTAKSEVRFRAPMPIGRTARIECALDQRKGRLLLMHASARDKHDDTLYAQASASFMLVEPGPLGA